MWRRGHAHPQGGHPGGHLTLTDEKLGVIRSMKEIDAVGHRVAHGGEFFADSAVVTEEVAKQTESLFPLAPLHNPANMTGYYACKEVMGEDVPQVLTFDTAFHQTMPAASYMYAVPYEYYEKVQDPPLRVPRHQPQIRGPAGG